MSDDWHDYVWIALLMLMAFDFGRVIEANTKR